MAALARLWRLQADVRPSSQPLVWMKIERGQGLLYNTRRRNDAGPATLTGRRRWTQGDCWGGSGLQQQPRRGQRAEARNCKEQPQSRSLLAFPLESALYLDKLRQRPRAGLESCVCACVCCVLLSMGGRGRLFFCRGRISWGRIDVARGLDLGRQRTDEVGSCLLGVCVLYRL